MARVKFHISGQAPGEYQRGGALQRAAQHVGGTGRLESQGPPGLTARADLGKLHRTRRLRGPTRDARHDPPAGQPELADTASLVHHGPGGRSGIIRAERPERERPLPPRLEATTGAACYRTNANINGWGCYNFDGRTLTVGGVARSCGQMPLTRSADGYYYFAATAGQFPWAGLFTW